MPSIYKRALQKGAIDANAPTVGQKIMYVVATILETLEDSGVDTDASSAKSVINRCVELGCDPRSTALRAMEFDCGQQIYAERQGR